MNDSNQETANSAVPDAGYLRLRHILGDSKSKPPLLPLIPVSKAHFWAKVKEGVWPQPIKISDNITVWKTSDIKALMDSFENREVAA